MLKHAAFSVSVTALLLFLSLTNVQQWTIFYLNILNVAMLHVKIQKIVYAVADCIAYGL